MVLFYLQIVDVPIHEAPAKGLLVKTSYAGVCHSDLHFIKDKLNIGDGVFIERSKILAERGKLTQYSISQTLPMCAGLILGQCWPALARYQTNTKGSLAG